MPGINVSIDICCKINIFVLACTPLTKSSIDVAAASTKTTMINEVISRAYCSSHKSNNGQWHFLDRLVLITNCLFGNPKSRRFFPRSLVEEEWNNSLNCMYSTGARYVLQCRQ